jgi:hypothetical protein
MSTQHYLGTTGKFPRQKDEMLVRLADHFRTLLVVDHGSGSIFQQLRVRDSKAICHPHGIPR